MDVPFFFRIKGTEDQEGLLYLALEKENETTYYCLGSRKLSALSKDGKTVWRIEQENGIGAYYDSMPVESMDIIYEGIQPMNPRDTRAFIRENSHLLHARHVDKLYTDETSYWYTPNKFVPNKNKSIKIRASIVRKSNSVKKSSRISKHTRVSKYTRVRSVRTPRHKTSL
jgi:hypothetical protein